MEIFAYFSDYFCMTYFRNKVAGPKECKQYPKLRKQSVTVLCHFLRKKKSFLEILHRQQMSPYVSRTESHRMHMQQSAGTGKGSETT
jgi:hypothetical protein